MIPVTDNFKAMLNSYRSGQLPVRITIAGYSKVFTNLMDGIAGHYPWLGALDDLSFTINDLNGGSDQLSWGFMVQDNGGKITADFPSFVFEGKGITVDVGFPGLAQIDYCTVFQGQINSVASSNSNNEYYFSCFDNASKLSQVVYQVGDDGGPTSSTNIKTVEGHPLQIMMDLCALVGIAVDSTKLNAYINGPFAGVNFLFHLQQAPQADEFIKNQLLKPLGGYMWVNSAGLVTANFFYPLQASVAVGSFTPNTWMSIPEAEQTDMVNTVQMQFDKDDDTASASGNYLAMDTQEYAPSVALYGLYGEQVIQADGIRSAFQGFFLAALTSHLIFLRYGLKNLKFDQQAPESLWNTLLYEAGDVVNVTHPLVPDRSAGVMGVTNKPFEILNKTINFTEGRLIYTMIDASYLSKFGFFKWTPDGKAAYAAASSGDKKKYMFMCGINDLYSNSDPANGLG